MTRLMSAIAALIFALCSVFMPASAAAQDDAVRIETTQVGTGVYMLVGRGGNIGLSVGEDGAFMIDDQFAPLTDQILSAIAGITDKPVRFVINTHWHSDHTGGNENLGKAGAIIVAHENVRERMSTGQFMKAFNRKVEPAPEIALPIITFANEVTFHQNNEHIRVFHIARAHTDGDAMVHFPKADVLHMGDIFFNGQYPFIDLSSGGSIDGMIAGVDAALTIAGPETRIIPGHGPLTDRTGLVAYKTMLTDIRERVAALIDTGADLAAVKAARPSEAYDADWDGGFIKAPAFVESVYYSIQGTSPPP